MRIKQVIRKMLFGSGPRVSVIQRGLLKGLTFEIDTSVDTQQITGLYEREILEPVRRLAARARTAIDIGAGDGYYTLYFASRPAIATVIACEPDAGRVELLKRNLALNGSKGVERVAVKPVLVGNTPGTIGVETLLAGTADPVLLKVDVEGAEMQVLESARESIARRDVMLIVETHSAALERECIAYLENLGYTCTVRKPGWYRAIFPELRPLPHNQWLVAERAHRAVPHNAA